MREEYDFSKDKRGPVVPQSGKTRVTLWIDNDIIAEFDIGPTRQAGAIRR